MRKGLVVKHTGSNYTVRDAENAETVICTVRGKLRLSGSKTTNPIAVGDNVSYEPVENVVTKILPRKNYIIRKSTNLSRQTHVLAANIDTAFLIVTLDSPRTSFEFIDRFLVTAEAYKIPACLILNKSDLYSTDDLRSEVEYFRYVYRSAGYEISEVSSVTGYGIDKLKEQISGKIALFSGNSGVGKSTLINTVSPGLNLRTGAVSEAHNKGIHTTTFYEMFEAGGGFIIDSPGIKGFGLVDMDKSEIYHFFPEIFKESKDCKFGMCSHTHEPDCAVKKAVDEGRISHSRYFNYFKMFESDDGKYR